jgi:hypothetical protein
MLQSKLLTWGRASHASVHQASGEQAAYGRRDTWFGLPSARLADWATAIALVICPVVLRGYKKGLSLVPLASAFLRSGLTSLLIYHAGTIRIAGKVLGQ